MKSTVRQKKPPDSPCCSDTKSVVIFPQLRSRPSSCLLSVSLSSPLSLHLSFIALYTLVLFQLRNVIFLCRILFFFSRHTSGKAAGLLSMC